RHNARIHDAARVRRVVGEPENVPDLVREQAAPPQRVELGQDTVADRNLGRLETVQRVIRLLNLAERALRQAAIVENYTTRLHHRALVYNHDVQAGGAVPRPDGSFDRPGRIETVLDRDSVTVPARQRGGRGHQDHGRGERQGGSNEGSDGVLGQIHGVVSFRVWCPSRGGGSGYSSVSVRSLSLCVYSRLRSARAASAASLRSSK